MSYTYRGTGKEPKTATGRTACRCAAASPILFCALHEAAPALLEQLTRLRMHMTDLDDAKTTDAVIAHAEGRG